nr:envelope protein 2 variant 1089 [Hepacivirus hominis]MOY74007.1 envelope protein 2 variant 2986 [Hepacivirus hominis]MOY74433.1 envelope protein 2 variant 3412 [Hepacivirus hominis]MOY74750.1 envelope protein 2 variant 3729 [Hepacivirus hominis]MOY74908.1 envelope protein 2 variant 3887 [Hepacivirus hominis]
ETIASGGTLAKAAFGLTSFLSPGPKQNIQLINSNGSWHINRTALNCNASLDAGWVAALFYYDKFNSSGCPERMASCKPLADFDQGWGPISYANGTGPEH